MYIATPAQKSAIAFRLLAVGFAATAVVAPASASKRTPAPIVYATGSSSYPAGEPQYIEPSRAPDADTKKKKRIEFRYPDQPEIVYGTAGARKSESAAPMAFSSSSAAVDTATARKYASASAPVMSQPEPSYDPTLSPGAFDARATAARIEAQRQARAVESEALPSLVPAAPMTLQPQVLPSVTVAEVTGTNAPVFDETGVGIVYGDEFNGLPTANGEIYEAAGLTAAHPSLPLPSLIQVTNVETGRDVVVRVNDRGPFDDGAALQVSSRAAAELGMTGAGRANLRIRYLGAAPAVATAPVMASYQPEQQAAPAYQPAAYQAEPAPVQMSYASYQPSTPPAPAAITRGAGNYFVQLGSFSDISNAQYLSNQVPQSLPVSIVPARVNGADYFRVRVGPVETKDDAERLRDQMSYSGLVEGRVVSGN